MKRYLLLPLVATALLAACGDAEETATEQPTAPTPTESLDALANDSLPPPNAETVTSLWAEACPGLEKVNGAKCLSKGMGAEEFACEFGLGDDPVLRHDLTITKGDNAWVLADPENVCAEGA